MNNKDIEKKGIPESVANTIADRILLIRREKVLLDSDLANLYGVETRGLI